MTKKHKDIPYHLMFEKEGYDGYAEEEHCSTSNLGAQTTVELDLRPI